MNSRRTTIMTTLTTERCTPEMVRSLRNAGMGSVRINSAHVTPDDITKMVGTIRSIDPGIKILMDTKGPEIRTTHLIPLLEIVEGMPVTFQSGTADSTPQCICVMMEALERYVKPGNQLWIDDGELRFEVTATDGHKILTRALNSGTLGAKKTVAVPGVELPPLPAVSMRDAENIETAKAAGIDMIAHSFVRSRADVEAVREHLKDSGIVLYAKIECRQALDNFEEITASADGILVARGDLGTAIPVSDIPAAQYDMLRRCAELKKPTIVATQILHSMQSSPNPTRAEVSDIALAVMEGAYTLLLCGETAVGQYPVKCVEVMYATIESASKITPLWTKN